MTMKTISRRRTPLRDVTINGHRWIERENKIVEGDGEVHDCRGRDCDFFRRGECWIKENLGPQYVCNPKRYWSRVDEDGYVLDRDGHNWFETRIDEERNLIDKEGNKKGYKI